MRVYLDSIGCRLNQSEIERIARDFREAGHELAARPEDAHIAVINTCAVTARAAAESRKRARHLGERASEGVILTGCWSTMHPQRASTIANVRHIVENAQKRDLFHLVVPDDPLDSENGMLAREPIPGLRSRTRAFIKIQEGCDLRCTYCITTLARGPGRSIPVRQVIDDINYAQRGGVNEVILTGVHLGSWGRDLQPERGLADLVQEILNRTDVPRIRLSSLEPWDLNCDLFALWQNSRLCRHLHLPLQSGSDKILRRMARRTSTSQFAEVVAQARDHIPGLAITTDLIAGFPGETDRDFLHGLYFVEQMSFADGHIFPYSERAGTAAAEFNGIVPTSVRKERSLLLRKALKKSSYQYRHSQLGTKQCVLWEAIAGSGPHGFELCGWTDNYIRVESINQSDLSNTISTVRLKGFTQDTSKMIADLSE